MQEKNISANNFEECMKCTICTAYCPVVKVNPLYPGPKQAGPDGERLRLKSPFFFDENLKYCLNCKRCEVACPSGVKIADIIQAARVKYSKHKPTMRDWILANTDFMGKAARPFAPIVNSVVRTEKAKNMMDRVLKVDKHRTFPEYQAHGFVSWFMKNAKKQQGQFERQISYYHSCSTEYQHPDIGIAFVQVMNALGVGVNLLDERCCGVAMISNGLYREVKRNAVHNIKEFEKAVAKGQKIVTTASTCTFTMRDEYPDVLGIDNSSVRDSVVIAEKYIYELIDSGKVKLAFKNGFKAKVAYHVPCHMEKLGWKWFTLELLKMIPGMELTELDSNCCGIAGTYGFKKEYYKYSQAIGKPLFDQIKSIAPEYVACECDTCKWQIEMSTGFEVKNPIKIMAEALDLEATARINCR